MKINIIIPSYIKKELEKSSEKNEILNEYDEKETQEAKKLNKLEEKYLKKEADIFILLGAGFEYLNNHLADYQKYFIKIIDTLGKSIDKIREEINEIKQKIKLNDEIRQIIADNIIYSRLGESKIHSLLADLDSFSIGKDKYKEIEKEYQKLQKTSKYHEQRELMEVIVNRKLKYYSNEDRKDWKIVVLDDELVLEDNLNKPEFQKKLNLLSFITGIKFVYQNNPDKFLISFKEAEYINYDAIILDINFNNKYKDGLEINLEITNLFQENPNLKKPVIFLTGEDPRLTKNFKKIRELYRRDIVFVLKPHILTGILCEELDFIINTYREQKVNISNVEKYENKCESLFDNRKDYYFRLKSNIEIWKSNPKILWYYNKVPRLMDHELIHCEGVYFAIINFLNQLKSVCGFKFSDEEIYAILSAAWLHDIGHCGTVIIKEDNTLDSYMQEADVRKKHGEISYHEILARKDIYNLNFSDFPSAAECIAYISKYHQSSTKIHEIKDIKENSLELKPKRLKILISILRFIDAIDNSRARIGGVYSNQEIEIRKHVLINSALDYISKKKKLKKHIELVIDTIKNLKVVGDEKFKKVKDDNLKRILGEPLFFIKYDIIKKYEINIVQNKVKITYTVLKNKYKKATIDKAKKKIEAEIKKEWETGIKEIFEREFKIKGKEIEFNETD